MPSQKTYWILDKDSILCLPNSQPVAIAHANVIDDAIDVQLTHSHQDGLPDGVISKEKALAESLIVAYGERYDSRQHRDLVFVGFRQLLSQLTHHQLDFISRGIQLSTWRQDHRFCSRCGTPTQPHAHELAMTCPNCRLYAYPKIQPCVIVAITRQHPLTHKPQILLALHHRHHQDVMYGLVAGFVEAGERLESAVCREVLEEVGLHIHQIRYAGSQPWPYPTNVMIGFIASHLSGDIKIQDSELKDAQFFDLDDLPNIPSTGTIARSLIEQVIAQYATSPP